MTKIAFRKRGFFYALEMLLLHPQWKIILEK